MFTNSDNTDHNPISNQDSPLIFSNFPSPFFDENELPLNQILPPHCNPVMAPDQNNSGFTIKETSKRGVKAKSKEKADNIDQPTILRRRNLGVVPRKRSGKKDRHSKICTAQGIRDRRMRLSLQVARKFFDLQDLLGYDKASNTIEWLFSKSKKAIKDLMTKDIVNYPPQLLGNNNFSISDAKSESFISECEVVSESKRFFTNSPFEGVNQESGVEQLSDVGTIEKLLGNSRLSTSNCPISDDNYKNYDQCCLSGGGVTCCCIDPNSNFMGFLGNLDMFNNDRLINCSHYTVTNQETLAAVNNQHSVLVIAVTASGYCYK
ncbi:hypothetical protein DH2020_032209 [Rehmannia glutinosa]|uniref:TCP domain-containing protein n=1 Tax=Rehmannia glutinosa TaxID=99300 RepID=A0ABR0VFX1_REHGL